MARISIAENNTTVVPSETTTIVDIGPAVFNDRGFGQRYRATGSDFDGSDGDTGRSYAFSSSLGSYTLVMINGRVLDPTTEYSVSDTTLTVTGPLFDDEVVLVWR